MFPEGAARAGIPHSRNAWIDHLKPRHFSSVSKEGLNKSLRAGLLPLHLRHAEVGIFLGGTIHDVAQVAGAGFGVSEETGRVAIVKPLGVALLVPIVLVLSLTFHSRRNGRGGVPLPVPGFLFGFVALVVLNTAGIIPPGVGGMLKDVSRW
jgi:uncharacterized membrane protein YadS